MSQPVTDEQCLMTSRAYPKSSAAMKAVKAPGSRQGLPGDVWYGSPWNRAVRFRGDWDDVLTEIHQFRK
jgi:hypothetical protein